MSVHLNRLTHLRQHPESLLLVAAALALALFVWQARRVLEPADPPGRIEGRLP